MKMFVKIICKGIIMSLYLGRMETVEKMKTKEKPKKSEKPASGEDKPIVVGELAKKFNEKKVLLGNT